MKNILLTVLTIVFSVTLSFTQDLITKKDGEDIKCKILEVLQTEIKYKKWDNVKGPTFALAKSDILMVRYENGTKDIFNKVTSVKPTENIESPYRRGNLDAIKYYGKYRGAGTGTLITALVAPVFGLIPALATSSTPPKEFNLGYPDANLMKNSEYARAYRTQAHQIKKKKVWKNFGMGVTVSVIAYLFVL